MLEAWPCSSRPHIWGNWPWVVGVRDVLYGYSWVARQAVQHARSLFVFLALLWARQEQGVCLVYFPVPTFSTVSGSQNGY